MSTPEPLQDPVTVIAEAALAQALILCAEWFGGNRDGDEWHALRDSDGNHYTVSLRTGAWCADRPTRYGADLVTLYMDFHRVSEALARERITERLGIDDRGIEVLPAPVTELSQARKRRKRTINAAQVQELKLILDAQDHPYPSLANVALILSRHEKYAGKIWFDSFRERVMHSLDGVPRAWSDIESMRVLAFIQQELRLPKFQLMTVHDAVIHHAHEGQRNSLTQWLDALVWDGIARLDTWLYDCLGVEPSDYTQAVARNWLVSMVARAFEPGCQADHMPVLEGVQGSGKSSALKVLGGEWYAAVSLAFGDREFLQTIQGRWLIEIPDMAGMRSREHAQIIATLSTRADVYRSPYARHVEEHPRRCVFAATSESDDYLRSPHGRRRYWPLRCGQIDLDALRAVREQLLAEAVDAYRNGSAWHAMPMSADREQLARVPTDPWTDAVLDYLEYGEHPPHLTSHHILTEVLKLRPEALNYSMKRRVHHIMSEAGWRQLHERMRYWVKLAEVPAARRD